MSPNGRPFLSLRRKLGALYVAATPELFPEPTADILLEPPVKHLAPICTNPAWLEGRRAKLRLLHERSQKQQQIQHGSATGDTSACHMPFIALGCLAGHPRSSQKGSFSGRTKKLFAASSWLYSHLCQSLKDMQHLKVCTGGHWLVPLTVRLQASKRPLFRTIQGLAPVQFGSFSHYH